MSVKRKRYSAEYKLEAVQAYEQGERSIAQWERDLGLAKGLLRRWRRELLGSSHPTDAFPGKRQVTGE